VKDVYEVLLQKELECARLRIEIEALRLVIPLLADGHPMPEPDDHEQGAGSFSASESTSTDGTDVPRLDYKKSGFWGRHRENKN
jgi:hypothetical protein